MSRKSCSRGTAARGFTLMEAMVSLVIMVIMLTVITSLLFAMRSFAQRQQTSVAPRQSARAALDYLTHYLDSAGDLNTGTTGAYNPNALVMAYRVFGAASDTQASYNNVTNTAFADAGTDIISLAIPEQPQLIPIVNWPFPNAAPQPITINYSAGCGAANNDANNLSQFQQAIGVSGGQSAVLIAADSVGNWTYFRITNVASMTSTCTNKTAGTVIVATAIAGQAGVISPPGGQPAAALATPKIMCGVNFRSFRVLNQTLQQKNDLFDPTRDNNPATTTFFPLAENVEDLQVAYLYGQGGSAGQLWNTGYLDATTNTWQTTTLAAGNAPNGVPPQVGPRPGGGQWDITNVIGVRVSLTTRSLPLSLSSIKLTNLERRSYDPSVAHHFRPGSEDNAEGPMDYDATARPNGPVYDHSKMTVLVMLRNRTLGS